MRTDPSSQEAGMTHEQVREQEIRNESYKKGHKDGFDAGLKEGKEREQLVQAMLKFLGH
ncbi:hypothetical protein [Vibrio parahaemolyticus]|uniref:hypothetical protein n=1 Tax=Vibrio parahaemolyticus TaxID=670 RepID=UPI0015DD9FFB|nr:hypothetical protein [Vibrio parahaemolyticus]